MKQNYKEVNEKGRMVQTASPDSFNDLISFALVEIASAYASSKLPQALCVFDTFIDFFFLTCQDSSLSVPWPS